MKKLFFAGLLLAAAFAGQAQEVEFMTGEWKAVLEKAKKEKKHIMIDMYFTGCMPCAEMDRTTFKNPAVSEYMNASYISYKTDVMKEDNGKALVQRYAVSGFPTYVLLSPEGKTLDVFSGYTNAAIFMDYAKSAVTRSGKKQFMNYSPAGDAVKLPGFYMEMYNSGFKNRDRDAALKFLDEQKDLQSELAFLVLSTTSLNDKYNNYFVDHAAELAEKFGRIHVRNRTLNIVGSLSSPYTATKDFDGFNRSLLAKVKKVYTEKEWKKFGKIFVENFFTSAKDVAGWAKFIETSGFYDAGDKIAAVYTIAGKISGEDFGPLKNMVQTSGAPEFDVQYTLGFLNWKTGQKESALAALKLAVASAKPEVRQVEIENARNFLAALESGNATAYEPKQLFRAKPMVMGE